MSWVSTWHVLSSSSNKHTRSKEEPNFKPFLDHLFWATQTQLQLLAYMSMCIRWVSVVEFHDRALCIGKVFGQELTVVEWNYQILGLHQVTVHQKLGVILVIKWFKNWSQQKKLFTKKVSLNWYFSMNFFLGKIWMIFDIENSLWKSKIGTFWQTVTRWRLKIW